MTIRRPRARLSQWSQVCQEPKCLRFASSASSSSGVPEYCSRHAPPNFVNVFQGRTKKASRRTRSRTIKKSNTHNVSKRRAVELSLLKRELKEAKKHHALLVKLQKLNNLYCRELQGLGFVIESDVKDTEATLFVDGIPWTESGDFPVSDDVTLSLTDSQYFEETLPPSPFTFTRSQKKLL